MSNPGWSRILIVEGTSGVGKSTLLDAMMRRYIAGRAPRTLRTMLHLTQAHTYGPLAPAEDLGTLTAADNLRHLGSIVAMLEWYVTALAVESRVKFFALIDTLHLTHCHRPGVVAWADVCGFDGRLARLGVRMLFLEATAKTIWERGIFPRRHEAFIVGYANPKFGRSLEEIHGYFVDEQARMRRLLDKTSIPYLVIDADADAEMNLARALAFWLD